MSYLLEKARIPNHHRSDCIVKCRKLYEDLRSLEKHKTRTTELNINKQKEFEKCLNGLFDIAYADALDIIKLHKEKRTPRERLGEDKKQLKVEKRTLEDEILKLLKVKWSIVEPGT